MMRKLPDLVLDSDRPRRRRWRYAGAVTVAVGLLLAPLVYEATLLSVAQWRGMTGTVQAAHTPIFDALGSALRAGYRELSAAAAPAWRARPWKPSVVVPFAVVWTVLTALLLRRG